MLREAGWRLIVSARGVLRTEGFPYALDNGAWTAHQRGEPFDEGAFGRAVDLLGEGADWTVLPDIVAGGLHSLEVSLSWLDRVPGERLIAVQDGMGPEHVLPYLGPSVGIFLGGSTEWKLATMRRWGELAREAGCRYHVGRVNTRRRIRMCVEAGAHSFDGTSVTRFAASLPKLEAERSQRGFVW